MKNLLIATAVLATLASAPAFAATPPGQQSGVVTLNGEVASACTAAPTTAATVTLPNLSTGVGELVAGSIDNFSGAYGSNIICNHAGTTLTLWAKDFTGSAPVPVGAPAEFTNTIKYTADLNIVGSGYAQTPVAAGRLVRDNSGTVPTTQTVGLLMTDISLDLSNAALPPLATTMVAGTYTSEVTITLTPGI